MLAGLFGASVYTQQRLLPCAAPALLPSEEVFTSKMVPNRKLEFRVGRECARAAMAAAGFTRVAIPLGDDRAPVWPDGVVGSITHTGNVEFGFVAAAVASSERVGGLGLDAELDTALERELWGAILRPAEQRWLESLPSAERGRVAKLFFSAKESVYKAQYPLSRQFLEFADLELTVDLADETFRATFQRGASERFAKGSSLAGRFRRRGGLLVTAVEF